MRTIGPGLRLDGVIRCALLLAMMTVLAVIQPDLALWMLATAIVVAIIIWAQLRAVRLEITDSVVRAKQGWYAPQKQAARSEIRAIHFFPVLISFRGPYGKPIMKVGPNWTLRQMLVVADELGVPLYDHRRWLGLRRVRTGRLVNQAAPTHPGKPSGNRAETSSITRPPTTSPTSGAGSSW